MRLRFDNYVLDVVRRELWCGSASVAIEPQVFDLLAYLAQNPDRVVSRDELLQAIWDGRIVSDSAIANRINAARRAIGDSGEAQRLIRTVPRKGFRFISQVAEAPVEAAANQVKAGYRRSMWRLTGAALVGAAIAIILARPETFSGRHPGFQLEAGALSSVLVSALPVKALRAGGDEPGLVAITADEPALGRTATSRRAASATPATKSNRDVAAAALPAGSVLPAATPLAGPVIPAAAEQKQKVPLPDVNAITPAPIQQVNPFSGHTRVDEAKWPVVP
jgi:DNA-binding winged helix-turn-helix (wHTH) protein